MQAKSNGLLISKVDLIIPCSLMKPFIIMIIDEQQLEIQRGGGG